VTPRLYCPSPLAAGGEIVLPQSAAHHALTVLRLKRGDAVRLFDGEGGEFAAELCRADAHAVIARVGEREAIERESPLAVTLVQGLAAAERMDYVIQKAVELGVAAIAPVTTARGATRLDGVRAERRLGHWRRIAIASCEQCGRNRLPSLYPLCDLSQWLREPSAASLRLLLAPEAVSSLPQFARPAGAVELLVGPEGGLAPEETIGALRAGFQAVRIGPRTLRTETAGPAMLAAMNALWGDWR
jgi:16S rRNA (uracil1498-N3)-methyltransferase